MGEIGTGPFEIAQRALDASGNQGDQGQRASKTQASHQTATHVSVSSLRATVCPNLFRRRVHI
jgi:hypothetical protein